jgi:hypothetical protein
MATAKPKPKLPIRKILLIALLIIAAAVTLAPAAAYGGFAVNVATVKFSETTGSLTTTTPQTNVASMNVYQYMLSRSSGPVITVDKSTVGSNVAQITMVLNLSPPTGQTLATTTVNIQGSTGTRDHTIYLGPGEGVKGSGNYSLSITISVQIITPQGTPVESLSQTIVTAFTVT